MRCVILAVVTSVVQRHYWLGTRTSGVAADVDPNETAVPNYGARAAYFEPVVSNRNIGVKIRNLTKVLISVHHIGALKMPEWYMIRQDAQLSQRDGAAWCVIFGHKWKTGTGRQYYFLLFNHCDNIGLQSNRIR